MRLPSAKDLASISILLLGQKKRVFRRLNLAPPKTGIKEFLETRC